MSTLHLIESLEYSLDPGDLRLRRHPGPRKLREAFQQILSTKINKSIMG